MTIHRCCVFFLWALTLVACATTQITPPAAPPTPVDEAAPSTPAPVATEEDQEPLFDLVPSTARAVLIFRRSSLSLPLTWLDRNPQMRNELARFLERTVGVDLTRVRGMVAWATRLAPKPAVALVLHMDASSSGSPLKGSSTRRHQGVDLVSVDQENQVVAARIPGGVAVGNNEAVIAAIDLAHGRLPALGKRSLLAPLQEIDGLGVSLLAGIHAPSVPQLAAAMQKFGVETITLTLDSEMLITLSAMGDPSRLRVAQALIRSTMIQALGGLEAKKKQALAGSDIMAGITAIVSTHQMQKIFEEAEPKLEGSQLVMRYAVPKLEMSSGAPLVAYVGILAAVAIPTFIKYIRRSKAAEARSNLQRMRSGLEQYVAEHGKKRGRFSFPTSTPWTPDNPCCKGHQAAKCQPDASTFAHRGFRAIGFQLAAPHYYQYRITSKGRGKRATVTIEAKGDLDCDGKHSSYKLIGSVVGDYELSFGEMLISDPTE